MPIDLKATSKAKHQVKSALLLDVVIREGAAILELFASKDQTLLVRGDPLLILDFLLDSLNCVRALNFQSDSLSGEGLDEDLHSSAKTKHQVKGALLLDIVVRESAPVLKLLPGENQTLLVRGDSLLILEFFA